MKQRLDVVAEARTWIGTPWVHQQRTKGIGVDCAGLVIGVARELGIVDDEFDINGYVRVPDGTLLKRCSEMMQRIDLSTMRPADVVVVATETEPAHMGIVGDYHHGGLSLIHASNGRGVIEHRLMFARNLRFRAAYVLPGIV